MGQVKTYFLLLGLILYGINSTYSQSNQTDCKEKIDSLNEYASSIGYTSPDSCIELSNLVLELSKNCFDSTQISRTYGNIAEAKYLMGDLPSGISYIDSALKIARNIDSGLVADLHLVKANCYSDIGLNNSAIYELYTALKTYTALADTPMIAASEYNFGLIYYSQKNYFLAKDHFKNSIKYYEYTDNQADNQQTYIIISMIYSKLHQFDSAQVYIDKANNIEGYRTMFDSGFILNSLSLFNEEQGKYDTALTLLKKSAKIFNQIPDLWSSCDNFICQANLYNRINKPEQALLMLDSAVFINQTVKSNNYDHEIYTAKAMCYSLLGDYKKSSHYGLLAANLIDSIQIKDFQTIINNDQDSYSEIISQHLKDENRTLMSVTAKKTEQLQLSRIFSIISLILGILAIVALIIFIRNNQKERKENKFKNKVLSVIGHDIRTPMSQMETIVEMIDSGDLDLDTLKAITPDLKKSVNKAKSSVENILEWARSELVGFEPKQELVDISMIIDQAIQYNDSQIAEKSIVPKIDGNTPCFAFADKNHVLIGLRNIINNAIKFSNEGGSIYIIFGPISANFIEVTITDNGVGMSDEIKSQLFRKAIDNRNSGTGIGLMLSKEYIEVNGGKIDLKSEVGNGTTFTITLPKA